MIIKKKLLPIFQEIQNEREAQDAKFGIQNHCMHNFFDRNFCKMKEKFFREINKKEDFRFSWLTVLLEEVYEAFAETKIEKQRAEMIQVAAVAVAIIEYLDREKK